MQSSTPDCAPAAAAAVSGEGSAPLMLVSAPSDGGECIELGDFEGGRCSRKKTVD
jgi:hypothetical protein